MQTTVKNGFRFLYLFKAIVLLKSNYLKVLILSFIIRMKKSRHQNSNLTSQEERISLESLSFNVPLHHQFSKKVVSSNFLHQPDRLEQFNKTFMT